MKLPAVLWNAACHYPDTAEQDGQAGCSTHTALRAISDGSRVQKRFPRAAPRAVTEKQAAAGRFHYSYSGPTLDRLWGFFKPYRRGKV